MFSTLVDLLSTRALLGTENRPCYNSKRFLACNMLETLQVPQLSRQSSEAVTAHDLNLLECLQVPQLSWQSSDTAKHYGHLLECLQVP